MDYGLAMGTFRWEWRGVLNLHHVFMLCVFCIHDNEMCICLFLVFSILSHLTVAVLALFYFLSKVVFL